jgi:hypothetical protein
VGQRGRLEPRGDRGPLQNLIAYFVNREFRD